MLRSILGGLLVPLGGLGMLSCRASPRPLESPVASLTSSSAAGWIAFIRDGQVWVMRPDGGQAHPLTPVGEYSSPAVSPDGQQVAFVLHQGEESDIYLVDLKGGLPRRLTRNLDVFQPAWSPQGRHLSYLRLPAADEEEEGPVELLHPVVLRDLREEVHFNKFQGSGSPQFLDEETLFLIQTDENETIRALWRLRLDSSGGEQIALPQVDFDPYFCHPAISPDGQRLAYVSLSDQGEGHLIQTLAGDILTRWGPYPPLGSDVPFEPPLWSPDGQWVLFNHTDLRDTQLAGIWVTAVKTGQSRRLYSTTADGGAPRRIQLTGSSWSPDSRKLALGVVETSGFGEAEKNLFFIVLVDVSTGQVTRLAENAAEPSWGG